MINNTKMILAESFCEILKKHSFNKISVGEIVLKCGAGRQTFYNHFKDKFDLVSFLYGYFKEKYIPPDAMQSHQFKDLLLSLATMLEENKTFFRSATAFPEEINLFGFLYSILMEFYKLSSSQKEDELYLFACEYATSGAIDLFLLRLNQSNNKSSFQRRISDYSVESFVNYIVKCSPGRLQYL